MIPFQTIDPATTSPLVSRARAAFLILEHAARVGLPMPFSVRSQDYEEHAVLQFHTLADVAQWALWIDATVDTTVYAQDEHHKARGEVLDHPVELVTVQARKASA